MLCFFFFSSRRRHTRYWRDWSSDVCSSDLLALGVALLGLECVDGEAECGIDGAHPLRVAAGQIVVDRHDVDPLVRDRKSVVEGKSVDLGGRRIIKKKKTENDRCAGSVERIV